MEIVITGRHTQIKQRFRDVVDSKMNRVTAIAPDAQRIQVVLTHEGNPRQADSAKRVELTVQAGKTVIRAEASSADEFSALDMALDKLTQRLRRVRDRRKDHRRGLEHPPLPAELPVDDQPGDEGDQGQESNPDNSAQTAVASDLAPGQSVEVQVGDTPIVIRRKLHIAHEHRRGPLRDGADRPRLLPLRQQGDQAAVGGLPPARMELRRLRDRYA